MRKTVLALVISSSFFIACNESNATKKIKKENLKKAVTRDAVIKKGTASASFESKVYDFGTVKEGEIIKKIFKITNSGKTDLVISNAKSSCGCTIPVWPKDPIKPGETGDIEVKFNTSGKPNRQSKSVTLTTNTASGREILTIKGVVTPKVKK